MDPEQVLVPHDGSPPAERALRHALEHYSGANVTVLHVLDPIEAVYRAESGGPTAAEEWVEAARERGDRIHEAAREVAAEYDAEVATVTEVGKPAHVVLEYVADHDVDYVVMGSHGRKGLSRAILGSVAESVLRGTAVPVTVVG